MHEDMLNEEECNPNEDVQVRQDDERGKFLFIVLRVVLNEVNK